MANAPDRTTQDQGAADPQRVERLAELLERWEDAEAAGLDPTVADIAKDDTDLAADFQEVLRRLGKIDAALKGEPVGSATVEQFMARFAQQRYRPSRLHGSGGQGWVFEAEDTELHRPVILKCLQPHVADSPAACSHLRREAELTSRLEHPGILPIYGLGEAPSGSGNPYYAMRVVHGHTLDQEITRFHADKGTRDAAERHLHFRRLLGMFKAVCETMAYAHSRGIIHRDLKPDNVMIGSYGSTFVIDWGLAKQIDSHDGDTTADSGTEPLPQARDQQAGTTILGVAKGTIPFMSPEQARGEWDRVGPASDIYSLGATLYVLLTGRTPFQGTSRDPDRRRMEVLEQVQSGRPPQPPRAVSPEVPAALEAICLKAMAAKPEDRYATAEALAADIERYLADDAVSAWREPWTARAARWARRHRTLVLATGAALLVALLGVGAVAFQENRSKQQLAVAYGELDEKNRDLDKANRGLDEANRQLNTDKEELTKANEGERKATEAAKQSAAAERRIAAAEKKARQETQRLLYFAQISLAHREWLANNMRRADQVLDGAAPEFRDWEWRFLKRLLHTELATLDADWPVEGLARSRDGRILVAGRGSGVARWVRLPDLAPSGRMGYFRDPKDLDFQKERLGTFFLRRMGGVAVSPDGSLVAAASNPGRGLGAPASPPAEVKVWKAVGGEVWSRRMEAHGLAISGDGRLLAATDLGSIHLMDLASGKPVAEFKTPNFHPVSLAFSPDSSQLAAGSLEGKIALWDVKTEKEEPLGLETSGAVFSLAFSGDGQRLAAGAAGGRIDVWNLKALRDKDVAGQVRIVLHGHAGTVRSLAFHPTEPMLLASGSIDRTVKLWALGSAEEYRTLRGHEDAVTGVLFTPDGKQLISAGADHEIKFWDPYESQESTDRAGQCAAVSPDSRYIATTGQAHPGPLAEGAKAVVLWDAATGQRRRSLEDEKGEFLCTAISPDSRLVAGGGRGFLSQGKLLVWESQSGKLVKKLESDAGSIERVAFSPDGHLLVSAASGGGWEKTPGSLTFWDARTWKMMLSVGLGDRPPTSLAFSPDGKVLALAVDDGPVRLLDTRTGQDVRTFSQHEFYGAAFNQDGKLLVTTGGDQFNGGKIWVWHVATGQLAYELAGHSRAVRAAAFDPGGRRLASVGEDGTLRLWDTEARQEILSLTAYGIGNGVAFSRDGKLLVSSSGDFLRPGYTRIWRASQPEPEKKK